MRAGKKRKVKKETAQMKGSKDHQKANNTRSGEKIALQEDTPSQKGSQQEEECSAKSQENDLSSSSVDNGLRLCYTQSEINEEQDNKSKATEKTEDKRCIAVEENLNENTICSEEIEMSNFANNKIVHKEPSVMLNSQKDANDDASDSQKSVKRKANTPSSIMDPDYDGKTKQTKLNDHLSSIDKLDATKDLIHNKRADDVNDKSHISENQFIIDEDIQINNGLKCITEGDISNTNELVNDVNINKESKQSLSSDTLDTTGPNDLESKSSQEASSIKSNLSQGFKVSTAINEEETKDTYMEKPNFDKVGTTDLTSSTVQRNIQSCDILVNDEGLGNETSIFSEIDKSTVTRNGEKPAEIAESNTGDIKDDQNTQNQSNERKDDMPMDEEICNTSNPKFSVSNTETTPVSATTPTSGATITRSLIHHNSQLSEQPEENNKSLEKKKEDITKVTANLPTASQSADLTDSQLCNALDEGDFDMELDTCESEAGDYILKKKQEGESLVGSILRELGSVNKQMLRIKREIENAKRKIKPVKAKK